MTCEIHSTQSAKHLTMMKLLVCVVLAVLATAVTAQSADSCRLCTIMIGLARHHFNNTVNDQAGLQAQLLLECDNLINFGYTASQVAQCRDLINANIVTIYNELHDHPEESTHDACVHLNECAARQVLNGQMRQKFVLSSRGWLCSACESVFKEIDHLLPGAEGLTEEALKIFLDGLCDEVPFVSGILKEYVNKYLDVIFKYIQEHGTINADGICKIMDCC